MAIAFGAAGTYAADATNGPITPAYPTGITTATRPCAVTLVYRSTQGTIPTPSGWTLANSVNIPSGGTFAVFIRMYQSGDSAPSYTTSGSTGLYGAMAYWSDVDPTSPQDVASPTPSTGASATVSAPT